MTEQDGLNNFDFSKVSNSGKFLKFEAGKPVTIRVLTKDPVVSESEFGEEKITRLNFVVWNFSEEKAQILGCSMNMGRTFQRIGRDDDFGANLQQCDIKISPEGEKLNRTYDINVLRHSGNQKELTSDQIKEAADINLLKDVKDNRGRLSEWTPPKKSPAPTHETEKYVPDVVEEYIPDEPPNLDDIPF